jgi:membrane-associated phospholipid phosphatase
LALMNVAIYDATIAAWEAKYTYNRPRPSEADPSLATVVPNPSSPSYPSEHAVAAGAAATVLAYLFPKDTQSFIDKAEMAGQSRLMAGSGNECGRGYR